MTYTKRYKPPKYQGTADFAIPTSVPDTGDPYQNLAHGIVIQACDDCRIALKYKLAHDKAPVITDYLTAEDIDTLRQPTHHTDDERLWVARHKKPYRDEARWEAAYILQDRLNQMRKVRSKPEYRQYANSERMWVSTDSMIDDCEKFFNSDWFQWLTDLDGPELMRMIRREVVD